MAFETVYTSSALKGNNRQNYLRKKDLENLTEHNLLYFLKKSSYNVLHDYPCMGAFEKRLRSLRVEGPFGTVPDSEKQDAYSEYVTEVLKLLIPTDLMPLNFEKCSLIEYGTHVDSNSLDHLRLKLVAKNEINVKKIINIGKRILNELHGKYKLKQISTYSYSSKVEDCLLNFYLMETSFYPEVKIYLFGKGNLPRQILEELKIRELKEQFQDFHYAEIGMKDSVQDGLTYNLFLNGKSISEAIESENVLI